MSLRYALPALLLLTLTAPAAADPLQDANRLLRQGQPGQALEKVEQHLATKPRDAQGRFLKGVIFTEMNRTQDAIIMFQKLTEDYPELPEPYNNLAVIYAQQRQYEKAKQALEMAIRTHPSYATAHENLGDIYARMASQAYDKALQLDSSNASAQTKLSLIKDLMGASGKPEAGKGGRPPVSGPIALLPRPEAPTAKPEPAPAKPEPAPPAPPAQPAAPVATSAPATAPAAAPAADAGKAGTAGNGPAEVSKALDAWLAAWSHKDVNTYLARYTPTFKGAPNQTHAAWVADRKLKVAKPGPIQVSIEGLKVTMEGNSKATAKFRQHYKSASLKTSSNKVLTLVRQNGQWLIDQERVGK